MDRRALILGGGGVTGIAWETGLIAGLADRGVDLAAADVIIGTSAGPVAGTDIASGQELESLYQAQRPLLPSPPPGWAGASPAGCCGVPGADAAPGQLGNCGPLPSSSTR